MPIQVQGPDGQLLEFPDGTSQDTMKAAMRKRYGGPQQESAPPPRQAAPDEAIDPTEGMSRADKFFAGMGRNFTEAYRGAKQVGGAIADAIPGVDLTDFRRRTQADIDEARRLDAPLMNTGWGQAGNIAGSVVQLVGPGAALKGTGLASTLLPTTIRGNALQGAALGALAPTATGESRVGNALAGGAGGAVGAGLVKGGAKILHGARNALTGAGIGRADRLAAEQLLAEAENPASLNVAAPSLVPGVERNLAEESRDAGIARLSQTLRGKPGFNWGARDTANNEARTRVLESIAGTDADMAAAIESRRRATNSLYSQADKMADADASRLLPQIQRLANYYEGNKTIKDALLYVKGMLTREIPDAERIKAAKTPIEEFINSGRKSAADFESAKEALRQIRRGEPPKVSFSSVSGQNALKASQKAFDRVTAPHDRVRTLLNVRDSIGYMLDGKFGGESGAALRGSRELLAVRGMLDRVIAKASPEADQARNLFRDMSKPINRMEVGRELLRRSTQDIRTDDAGNRMLAAKPLANAVRNLDAIARKATGFDKAKAENFMASGDIALLKALQDDAERQAFAATQGTGANSATAARMGVLSRIGTGAGNALAAVTPGGGIAKSFIQMLDQKGTERVNERLAYLVANPAEARRVLAALPTAGQKILSKALAALAGTGAAATSVTAAAQDQPLELDISGGTLGPAPSAAEMDALRSQMRANAAGAY